MDGYSELSGAIIAQAIKDYYSALSDADNKKKSELERFFKSDWFEDLVSLSGSHLDGQRLMNTLKAKVKEETA